MANNGAVWVVSGLFTTKRQEKLRSLESMLHLRWEESLKVWICKFSREKSKISPSPIVLTRSIFKLKRSLNGQSFCFDTIK